MTVTSAADSVDATSRMGVDELIGEVAGSHEVGAVGGVRDTPAAGLERVEDVFELLSGGFMGGQWTEDENVLCACGQAGAFGVDVGFKPQFVANLSSDCSCSII